MNSTSTPIRDVLLLEPKVFVDNRGLFFETWNRGIFRKLGVDVDFIRDCMSVSKRGTLRGLHYQVSKPIGKLVRALRGEVFDVCVDIRRSSSTYGRWFGTILTGENRKQLWIPPGCAHGFYVRSETAEVSYKFSNEYAPEFERTLRWDDPEVGVEWPILKGVEVILSVKDRRGLGLRDLARHE